jgi:hypothetical protein
VNLANCKEEGRNCHPPNARGLVGIKPGNILIHYIEEMLYSQNIVNWDFSCFKGL